jgi:hypothetical protein
MKRIMMCATLGLCLGIAGCGVLEGAFGISRDPVTGEVIQDPGGGVVGTGLNWFIPGAGTLLGAALAAYANAKRGQWKKAAQATFKGVEEFAEANPSGAELKEKLAKHHQANKVYTFVKTALDKEGIQPAQ